MHESEGSVITDIWKTSAANYNTALRKTAEHEPISRNRIRSASEIRKPRLSMPRPLARGVALDWIEKAELPFGMSLKNTAP